MTPIQTTINLQNSIPISLGCAKHLKTFGHLELSLWVLVRSCVQTELISHSPFHWNAKTISAQGLSTNIKLWPKVPPSFTLFLFFTLIHSLFLETANTPIGHPPSRVTLSNFKFPMANMFADGQTWVHHKSIWQNTSPQKHKSLQYLLRQWVHREMKKVHSTWLHKYLVRRSMEHESAGKRGGQRNKT